jgi:Uma2 family endonuclease
MYPELEQLVQSPVKNQHSTVSENLFVLLKTFAFRHDLGRVGHEKLMVSLSRNDYEPDVSFWRSDVASSFTPGQMRFPAPDFVAEVLSPSTEAVDHKVKFDDYAAHGVREYWLVDPDAETVEEMKHQKWRHTNCA